MGVRRAGGVEENMNSVWTTLALTCAVGAVMSVPAAATSRIKDIADIEGVRENQLVGYGLVMGLQGTGDSLRNCPMTKQSLTSILEKLGTNARDGNLNGKNAAAVMVTANLPAFATQGSRIDVTVSALCDSKSLAGGQLVATPLQGADQQTYALAQGAVAIGGFSAEGASGSSVTRGVPTVGRIASGASIERELAFDLAGQSELRLALRNPDFTTAQRVAGVINAAMGPGVARATNPGTIVLSRAASRAPDMMTLLTTVERLEVEPDAAARIVIDETSGVIVMGENVRVSTAAIAQGSLTITVSEQPAVSQPAPLSRTGDTVVVPQSSIKVDEVKGGFATIPGGVPLRKLVDGLNALGVGPRDMISILQALKAAGAIQAEIEVM
jgi:flagellar P-ring protein precursor FlgI